MTKLEQNIPTKWSASVDLFFFISHLNNLFDCFKFHKLVVLFRF